MIASWSRGTIFSWLGEQRSDACFFLMDNYLGTQRLHLMTSETGGSKNKSIYETVSTVLWATCSKIWHEKKIGKRKIKLFYQHGKQ